MHQKSAQRKTDNKCKEKLSIKHIVYQNCELEGKLLYRKIATHVRQRQPFERFVNLKNFPDDTDLQILNTCRRFLKDQLFVSMSTDANKMPTAIIENPATKTFYVLTKKDLGKFLEEAADTYFG